MTRVSLFVTCLVDGFHPGVGAAAVATLRAAGCEVSFDPRQTCCGQPAHNTGYAGEAARVAAQMIGVFDDGSDDPIVVPSGSCAAMIKHAPGLFEGDPARQESAQRVAVRTHEFSSFLVDVLEVTDVGARLPVRAVWHDACHGLRDLGIAAQPRALLANVADLQLVEAKGEPTCCGFGGTFSVKQPEVSVAMLDTRLAVLEQGAPEVIISSDVSCLMQIGGRLERRADDAPRVMHLAEVLASR